MKELLLRLRAIRLIFLKNSTNLTVTNRLEFQDIIDEQLSNNSRMK